MSKRWFDFADPASLTITEFKSISNPKIMAQVTTTDAEAIKKIMKRIEKLPMDGDEMVKPGPNAQYHTLDFISADKKQQKIELINKSIKTPSTGFNSEDPDETETNLVHDIDSLLHPAYGKNLLKIRGLPFNFKGFQVRYDGVQETPDPALSGGPTLGPTSMTIFTVTDQDRQSQKVEIFEGQNPPQPAPFSVKKKKFVISVYGKTGLYPEYFEVKETKYGL